MVDIRATGGDVDLSNGNVYAGFASFCDIEHNNSRGWLLGSNASTLTPLASNQLNDTQAFSPNGFCCLVVGKVSDWSICYTCPN